MFSATEPNSDVDPEDEIADNVIDNDEHVGEPAAAVNAPVKHDDNVDDERKARKPLQTSKFYLQSNTANIPKPTKQPKHIPKQKQPKPSRTSQKAKCKTSLNPKLKPKPKPKVKPKVPNVNNGDVIWDEVTGGFTSQNKDKAFNEYVGPKGQALSASTAL